MKKKQPARSNEHREKQERRVASPRDYNSNARRVVSKRNDEERRGGSSVEKVI
jgi:hypothetical protein